MEYNDHEHSDLESKIRDLERQLSDLEYDIHELLRGKADVEHYHRQYQIKEDY